MPGLPPAWQLAQALHMRFVVIGEETSFTADFENDDDVDSDDLVIWQGAYSLSASGDADGDGDSDGRDFLAWQRQFTGSAVVVPSSIPVGTPVPEPWTISLFLVFAMAFVSRRCSK